MNYDSRSTPERATRISIPLLDDPAEAQLRVAYGARDRYTHNKTSIDQLELAFQAAVLMLGAQTVLWALALAVS